MTTFPTGATFTFSRDQIIRRSLRQIGAIQQGEIPDAATVEEASFALNAMVAEWQATGIHVWKQAEGVLFTREGQNEYGLGGSSIDNSSERFTQSAVVQGAQPGATQITIVPNGPISVNDNIGIILDNGSIFWSMVNDAGGDDLFQIPDLFKYTGDLFTSLLFDSRPATITIAGPLPFSATRNNVVYSYTNKIIRPLRVSSARRYFPLGQIVYPINPYSRLDYHDLPNKSTKGSITNYFYDPQLGTGRMHVWPTPNDNLSAMTFTWWKPILDFSLATDIPDFPQEWINAIVWGLAEDLAPEYDVVPQRMAIIAARAQKSFDLVSGFDKEPESVYFGVNWDNWAR
jgi:hypothetical protein